MLNENEDSDDTRPSIAKAADNSFENINASSSSIDKADLIDNEEKSRPSTDPNAELNERIANNDELNLKKKKLTLTASDNDITIQTIIDAKNNDDFIIENEGSIIIQGKYILDIVRKLPDEYINIEVIDELKILIYTENR